MPEIRRLLGFLKEPWRLVVLAVALGWATTVSWIALISASAWLISAAALRPSVAELQIAIVGVRFFGISRAGFRYLERLVSHTVTFKLLARMRVWLYARIEPQAPANLSASSSGDLLSRIVSDVETLQDFYVRVVAPPLVALLSSLGVLWFYGRWSARFALTILAFQILIGIILPLIVQRFGAKFGAGDANLRADLSGLIVDGVQGSAEITAFGREADFQERFNGLVGKQIQAENAQNKVSAGHAAAAVFGIQVMVILLMVIAIPMVADEVMDGRLLAVLVLGAAASFEAVLPLPLAFQHLGEQREAAWRLFELADGELIVGDSGEKDLEPQCANLAIRNLSFAYSQKSLPVLSGINLDLPPGKRIAILGPSGAGKSTLANLLLRFWDYSEGQITLNGNDLHQYSADSVRRAISYLPQNPFLFNATVMENILVGKPGADRQAVEAAVRAADLDDFICTLPDGYNTMIGEFGAFLSGGQRQRLALARAFLRAAPVYLLDEPAANLDIETENAILKALYAHLGSSSLVMITHRLTGLEKMDEIIVLEGGKIIERGTHRELLEISGAYVRMCQLQADMVLPSD